MRACSALRHRMDCRSQHLDASAGTPRCCDRTPVEEMVGKPIQSTTTFQSRIRQAVTNPSCT